MATTTKRSTRGKTKTVGAKTTAKKSTTKKVSRASAKTATKKTSVKSAVAKRGSFASRFGRATFERLFSLHMISAGLFLVLAVLAGVLMSNDSFQLTLGYMAKDELASTQSTVLAPAVQAIYDVEVRWLVLGTLLLSAVMPVLYLTRLRARYSDFVRNSRMNPYRWVDYGVTGGLMVATVALLSGVSDLLVLKLVVDLIVISAVVALIAERQNNTSTKPVWSAFVTSLFSGVVPWFLIAAAAVGTTVYGEARYSWFVYALYATLVIGFSLKALNEWRQYRRVGAWTDSVVVERNYVVLNMLTKLAFAVVLIVGLR